MATHNTVSQLLTNLNAPVQQTKQASAPTNQQTPTSVPSSLQTLQTVLHETKLASAPPSADTPDVASHLEKIAADIEASETLALVKEAQIFGAAFADTMVARLTGFAELSEKVAALTDMANMPGGKKPKPPKPSGKPSSKSGKSKKMPPGLKADLRKNASAAEMQQAANAGAFDAQTLIKIAQAEAIYMEKSAGAQNALQQTYNRGLADARALFSAA